MRPKTNKQTNNPTKTPMSLFCVGPLFLGIRFTLGCYIPSETSMEKLISPLHVVVNSDYVLASDGSSCPLLPLSAETQLSHRFLIPIIMPGIGSIMRN